VQWALRGGRRAIFAAFGLGKTIIQLEILRLLLSRLGTGKALIIAPLGVRGEFFKDVQFLNTGIHPAVTDAARAELAAWQDDDPRRRLTLRFIRTTDELTADGLYITNYESVRDGKLDTDRFAAVSLDEASCLRGLGSTKTFREFMRRFEFTDTYRFVCTATPSPNDFIELLAYAAFLGVMDVGQAKTRFFKRDSTKADVLTLHPHKVDEFWLWVSTWAIFLQTPSDLGFSDEGYVLPEMEIFWHEIPTHHDRAGVDRLGQGRMFANAALGVVDAAREKRDSLTERIAKVLELRALDPTAHRLLWHDLEAERRALEAAIPGLATVYGSQDMEKRESAIRDFSDGLIPELAAKPVLAGSGCNFQRHCHWAIFTGIGFKFNDFIQAVHRVQRFLQTERVRIDLIYTEAERDVRRRLEAKWQKHNELVGNMTAIIQKYGLGANALEAALTRSIGVERIEVTGREYTLINNDCVLETQARAENSVDLILTSIPFSTQYEYTPSYNDFGHTDDNTHFWQQMDFLIPELLRVLKPGRVAAIHVKDRIVPNGLSLLRRLRAGVPKARVRVSGPQDHRDRRGTREQSNLPFGMVGAV
jgi:SAM-dependent methyltransferase